MASPVLLELLFAALLPGFVFARFSLTTSCLPLSEVVVLALFQGGSEGRKRHRRF